MSTPMPRQVCLVRVLASTLVALGTTTQAQSPPNVTAAEMAMLPEYCIDTQGFVYNKPGSGNVSPRAPQWVAVMGDDFWHHHHYCWGLLKYRRATAPGVPQVHRTNWLRGAIGDYEYVIRRAKPTFVMLPEVLLRLGEAHLALDEYAAAHAAFEAALARKPDYWPAYQRWAEALAKVGKVDEARAHLRKAMERAPNEPALMNYYRELGGRDLPDVAPATSGR